MWRFRNRSISISFTCRTWSYCYCNNNIATKTYGWIVSIISIVFVVLVTYLVLLLEKPILKILGRRGSLTTTRVFAIFLVAIAVQYVAEGIRQYLCYKDNC
ncbi:MAG: hypothetical protein ICV56_06435 [Nitrososphaeraceae archaeon]|nr:hypothetical protein [Nitrososphaeraceae archaeon]